MEFYEREFFVYRIMSGFISVKIGNKRIKVYHPDSNMQYDAQEVYIDTFHRALENNIYTEDELIKSLISRGIWSDENENNLQKVLPGHIEYWKVELYNNLTRSKTRENIRKYLQTAKDEYFRLLNLRHKYDYSTCEGAASLARTQYIIENCSYYNDEKVIFDDISLSHIISQYNQTMLQSEVIRELAKTAPWENIWQSNKKNGRIFNNNHLSVEQSTLISWSSMYDAINESPECPPEDVIQDDDMLDGWLIIQRKKRDSDRNKGAIEGQTNYDKNAGEVFIPAETLEDAKRIDSLNDPYSSAIKQSRFKQIKEHGIVKETDLSDVKQDIMIQYNQQLIGKMRRK